MNWEPKIREQLGQMVGEEASGVQVIPIPRDIDVRNRISMAYSIVRQVIDASMEEINAEFEGSGDNKSTKEPKKQWFLVGVPESTRTISVETPRKSEFLGRIEQLISAKDFKEAERSLQERLETGVIHPSLIYLLSSVQVHLGKKAEARENLALLLRLKPDHERGLALAKKLET